MTLKAHVHQGRLIVDEPTELPEGTEVDLLPLDPGDWLDPADRAALHRALVASQADVEAGRLVDAEEVLKETADRVIRRKVRFTATAREHVRLLARWWHESTTRPQILTTT